MEACRDGAAKRPCHAALLGPLGSPRSSRQRMAPAGEPSKAWWLGPTALAGECFHRDFTLLGGGDSLLGRGTFGTVYRCVAHFYIPADKHHVWGEREDYLRT